MKRAPCVRFAILIRPKISENPAARRNSSPPSARLFSVCTTQNCTRSGSSGASSRFQVLRRRPVARIHRVLQELLGLVGPELADVGIGMDDPVDQPAVLALDLADLDVADDVAVLI